MCLGRDPREQSAWPDKMPPLLCQILSPLAWLLLRRRAPLLVCTGHLPRAAPSLFVLLPSSLKESKLCSCVVTGGVKQRASMAVETSCGSCGFQLWAVARRLIHAGRPKLEGGPKESAPFPEERRKREGSPGGQTCFFSLERLTREVARSVKCLTNRDARLRQRQRR